MPEPFRFFAVRDFPDVAARPYVVPNQTRIGQYDAADTIVKYLGESAAATRMLERIEIQHDLLVQAGGRAVLRMEDGNPRLESFSEYITTFRLEGYVSRSEGLALIEGVGNVVVSAFRTLRDHADRVTIAQHEVDFAGLAPQLGRIRGAWFSKAAGAVSALGMFGQDVSGSAEWEDAQLTAELRNLMFQHYFEDELRTLTITRDAGVVVYQSLPQAQLLRLVFDVYDTVLSPALKEPDFKGNRGTARDTGLVSPTTEDTN